MKYITSKLLIFAAILTVSLAAVSANAQTGFDKLALEKKVRHEILMLPYYDVFDLVQFKVSDSGTVTLYGQVNEYNTLKGAENRVKRLPGVKNVVNNIEILPLSNFDDELRQRTFYALARNGSLAMYLQGPNPDMRIIVRNGNITLAGTVRNKTDVNTAYITARGVTGSFSVTNNLVSEKDRIQ
jgi:hypothetical protein